MTPEELPPEEIYYIYNGTKNVHEPFTPNGIFLAQNCGFETICCLHEHGYKKTLGSMDINDLREYAEGRDFLHRTTGNPERGSELVHILKDGRYNQELAKFIERIKEVLKIKSFVTA